MAYKAFDDKNMADDKAITFGSNLDVSISYDETGDDGLLFKNGVEGSALSLLFQADQADDNSDKWKFGFADGGNFTLESKQSGSYVAGLTLTNAGALTVAGATTLSTIAAAGGSYSGDKILVSDSGVIKYLTGAELATDLGVVSTSNSNTFENSSGQIIQGAEGGAGILYIKADQGDDAGDEWKINVADGGVMTWGNDIASAGTFVTHLTLTPNATVSSSTAALAGSLTVAGGAQVTGNFAVSGSTTLAATSFGDANITNVGDIALDSISADGTDINIALTDNSATALTFKEGSTAYMTFETVNGEEGVIFHKYVGIDDQVMLGFGEDDDLTISHDGTDNHIAATSALNLCTANSGVAINLGHTTSEVTVGDNLTVTGDATLNTIKMADNSSTALTIKEGTTSYMTFITTDGDEYIFADKEIVLNDNKALSLGADGDFSLTHDGTDNHISCAAALNILTGNSGVALNLGHSTSEVTVGDNLTVTGNATISGNLTVSGTQTIVDTVTMQAANAIVFEGATADAHETTLTIEDPTADRTVVIPNVSGTLAVLAADSDTAITATPGELNLLDGGTSAGTTAVANGDAIVTNDGGTMRQTTVQTFQTYFDANSVGGSNIVTTGALDSGSITSGFGNIDNGTSSITTGGRLVIDVDTAETINASGGGVGAAGSITLGDGGDAGFYVGSDNLYIENKTQDKDIIFRGNDGGVFQKLLELDASDPAATIYGAEDGGTPANGAAILNMYADQGDDNADKFRLQSVGGWGIGFQQFQAGSWQPCGGFSSNANNGSGALHLPFQIKTGDYTITKGDGNLFIFPAASTTISLPTSGLDMSYLGWTIHLKDAGGLATTNSITIDAGVGMLLDGARSRAFTSNYESITVMLISIAATSATNPAGGAKYMWAIV